MHSNPGIITTAAPLPAGTPRPWYTGESRSTASSSKESGSQRIGRGEGISSCGRNGALTGLSDFRVLMGNHTIYVQTTKDCTRKTVVVRFLLSNK